MSERKVTTTFHWSTAQRAALQALSARTRIPMAELIREGIELVLRARAERVDYVFADSSCGDCGQVGHRECKSGDALFGRGKFAKPGRERC